MYIYIYIYMLYYVMLYCITSFSVAPWRILRRAAAAAAKAYLDK